MAGIRINPEGQNQQFNQQPISQISHTPQVTSQEFIVSEQNIPKQEQSQNKSELTPESTQTLTKMAENEQRDRSPDVDDDDKEVKLAPRKVYKFDDPPFVFHDVDVSCFIL